MSEEQEHSAWVLDQISQVYPSTESRERQTLTALWHVWQRLLQMPDGVGADAALVAQQFAALCQRQSIVVAEPDSRVWGPASQYHGLSNKARVVAADSASQPWKVLHREGVIVGKRHGYFVVQFTDTLADTEGFPSDYRGRPSDFEVDITHLHRKSSDDVY